MTDIDTDFTDLAVCPWCGFEEPDSWEFNASDEFDCGECGKPVEVEVHTSVTYSTSKVKKDGEK